MSKWEIHKGRDGFRVVEVPDDFDPDHDSWPADRVTAVRPHATLDAAEAERKAKSYRWPEDDAEKEGIDASQVRARRLVMGLHGTIASFARDSFASDGRGVVQVRVPATPPTPTPASAAGELVYHRLDAFVQLMASMENETREDAEVLQRMVETYDPATQAVVMAALDGGNPISLKMRLDRPALVDDPGGVH